MIARVRAIRPPSGLVPFYLVGIVNTVFGYSVFATLIWAGLNIYAAQLLSRAIGLCFNYFSYGSIVFRGSRLNFPRYLVTQLLNYGLAVMVLSALLLIVSNHYVAGLLCVAVVSAGNFVLMRTFVARARPVPAAGAVYNPYPISWRFLPERALLLKDAVRHYLLAAADALAETAWSRPLWMRCFGQRTIDSIAAAGVLFVHVPKTGGTSISRVLYNRNLPHFTAAYYRRVFAGRLPEVPSFAIIRDPVERFVSAYKFVYYGGSDIILASRFDRARLRRLESIDDFIAFLAEDPARLAISPTFLSQTAFVAGADGRVLVDRLFLMGPHGPPRQLLDWLGTGTFPHINASAGPSTGISELSRQRLRDLYAADFQLFERLKAAGGCLDFRGSILAPAPKPSGASAAVVRQTDRAPRTTP